MIDRLQKDAQREELEPGKTSDLVFLSLSLLQTVVVGLIASSLSKSFQIGALLSMSGHWIGFMISQLIHSDKYFDITEDVTLFVTLVYVYKSSIDPDQEKAPSVRQQVAFGFALLWCVRLCLFVGYRVLVRGSDWRFDKLITNPSYNFFGWTSGGTWCFFNCFCLWFLADIPSVSHSINSNQVHIGDIGDTSFVDNDSLNLLDYIGIIIFLTGFTIEIVSDLQKYRFNALYASGENKVWIETGLWSHSRHPNYAGEMILWTGMSIICISGEITKFFFFAGGGSGTNGAPPPLATFAMLKSLLIVSVTPIWSFFFLLFTSLMLLEKRADKKWGNLKKYQDYKRRVPVLFPRM